jgi:signal transduction histidine kinase
MTTAGKEIKLVGACMLVLMASCLSAQPVCLLQEQQMNVDVNSFAYQYADPNATLSAAEVVLQADSTAFVRNASRAEVNYGMHQPRAWCRFYVRNTGTWRTWVMKVQQSRVDTVLLYIVRKGHEPERMPLTGHFQSISSRPVYALPFAYAVTIEKGETVGFYLYTQRQYGRHAAVLSMQQSDYFQNYEYAFNVVIGLVSGMVLLAMLVGFVFFLLVRQKVYIYYSMYALSFFILLMGDTGLAHGLLSVKGSQTVVNAFTMIFYYWFSGWHMLFTVELLALKKHSNPWFYRLGVAQGYFFCASALLLMIPALPVDVRQLLVSFSYYYVFIVTGYILYAVAVSILKKEPLVYFYMAGFYFTVIVGILLSLSDFEVIYMSNQHKDLLYLTPLVEVLSVVLGMGVHFSHTLKERFRVQHALNKTQDQIITIQEDERRRIAQDLHDDVGNSLAAIRNMINLKREPAAIEKEMDTLIGTVRAISHDLMPVDFNEFTLVEIVAHTVDKFQDHPHIRLEFDHSGTLVKIKPVTELVIFRIINELINNILKHSQATEAYVQLMYQKDSLVVTVEDNGIGIDTSGKGAGIGLKSIQSRAEYINATLKIESDDKGTLIILEIPYGNG